MNQHRAEAEGVFSPIVFALENGVDFEDEHNKGNDEMLNSMPVNGMLGVCLGTWKEEGGQYSHQLHKIDYSKGHKIFKDLQEGDELVFVNGYWVTPWSHDTLLQSIQELENRVTFIFYRKSVKYVEHGMVKRTEELYIVVQFTVSDISSDAKTSDMVPRGHMNWISNVVVGFYDKITNTPTLTVVHYAGMKNIKIQHGSITHTFMCIKDDKLTMDRQCGSDRDAYAFKMYEYSVMDDNEDVKLIAAFQSSKNNRFLMSHLDSKKLSLVQDDNIGPGMMNIATNSPCLFVVTSSTDQQAFFLQSVVYKGRYLAYDVVDKLRLERLKYSPDTEEFKSDDHLRRNFSFTFPSN